MKWITKLNLELFICLINSPIAQLPH